MKQLVINQRITDRNSTSFQKYLNDVQATTILSAPEEVMYAKRSREGDEVARRILIESNLRFVISVAKQHVGSKSSLEDLINEGNYGLIVAADRYDETLGYKFISYAVSWIRRYIFDYLNSIKTIRLPLNKIQELSKINKFILQLEQKLGREVALNDLVNDDFKLISDELELDVDDYHMGDLYNLKHSSVTSYNNKVGGDGSDELIDVLVVPDERATDLLVNEADNQLVISQALDLIPEQHAEILEHLFGLNGKIPKNLSETGALFGVSRERIRQIREMAFMKIRRKMKV